MNQLPRQAFVVWLVWVLAGLLALVYCLTLIPGSGLDVAATAVLLVGGIAADFFTLRLPSAREFHRQETSVASALFVAAFLLLPVPVAAFVAAASYAIGWAIRPHQRLWFKNLFNLCQYAVAVGAAGLVWSLSGASSNQPITPQRLIWLLPAVLVYFVVNTGSVSLMVAKAQGLPFLHVWSLGNRHTLPAYFGTIFIGILLANLWVVAPWLVFLVAVPLVAIHFAFKSAIVLEEQSLNALFQLAEIIDQRDSYTHKHSVRVGEYAERIAVEMGLPADQAYLIYLAGRLHDIGKCAVDNEVLLKPGPLTEAQRQHMCVHAEVGGNMLQNFTMFQEVARYVRAHHERWDGQGYPDHLAGEAIPTGARVIAVADAYDAMTTTRPYRVALPHDEAVRRLAAGRGTQWDSQVIDVVLGLLASQQLAPQFSQVPAGAGHAVSTPTG